jgi:hypothetical protein
MANVEPKEKEDFDRIINFVDFEWTMYVSEKYRIRTITIMGTTAEGERVKVMGSVDLPAFPGGDEVKGG